ncbi:MAG TPA: hypothetical protein VFF04_04445 [Candidatus Babeliales bacterium]|nr:hypothetical protein [Candidatus Babeliales bacterium]
MKNVSIILCGFLILSIGTPTHTMDKLAKKFLSTQTRTTISRLSNKYGFALSTVSLGTVYAQMLYWGSKNGTWDKRVVIRPK